MSRFRWRDQVAVLPIAPYIRFPLNSHEGPDCPRRPNGIPREQQRAVASVEIQLIYRVERALAERHRGVRDVKRDE